MRGRTVLTIAHRLSTIRNAGRNLCILKTQCHQNWGFNLIVAASKTKYLPGITTADYL
jgi:ABC-type transport system involved in Fe-S cluster assembly fused permease/ATPase subunit